MKIVGVTICIILSGIIFFHLNQKNYTYHIEYKKAVVNHPEILPDKQAAKFTSVGYKNLVADLYWLQVIQYIGGNAIEAEYKKYLFVILDLITELNPYFESPYIIGQLLLPDYNDRYEDHSENEQKAHIRQGEALGLKGVKNFCDLSKIDLIDQEPDLGKIWKEQKYRNPCRTYIIPYYLAYIYFFYLNDPLTASKYYKVSSAQDDAPEGAKILAAIMQGKGGEREKSIFMFLSLAENVEQDESVCSLLSQELQKVYIGLNSGSLSLDGGLIEAIENSRKQTFPEFSREIEDEVLGDTKCINFLNKAIRELNLLYISNANEKFIQDHELDLPARHAQALLEAGYIEFLPTDYQQYEEYGIVYIYNYDTNTYDYEIGKYE